MRIFGLNTTSLRKRKSRPPGVSLVLPRELEEEIANWIRGMRAEGAPVSHELVQTRARALSKDNSSLVGFAASNSWLAGFKKRWGFSMRTSGRKGQLPPEQAARMAEEFAVTVRTKAEELGVDEIWNADETAVFFEMLPKTTLDESGTKTVWIKCAGSERRRVTVMLLGSSLGKKKSPYIVFKEQPSKSAETQEQNNSVRCGFGAKVWEGVKDAQGAVLRANQAGWFTERLTLDWLQTNFGDFETRGPILLLLDKFSAHWTDNVRALCERLNVHLLQIPAGCTSVSQPADVAWNKPFKNHIRKSWVEWLSTSLDSGTKRFDPPTRKEVIKWVVSSWENLTCTSNGFREAKFQVDILALGVMINGMQGLQIADQNELEEETEDEEMDDVETQK